MLDDAHDSNPEKRTASAGEVARRAKPAEASRVGSVLSAPWPIVPLGEICDVDGGSPAPQGEHYFSSGTVPFVRMRDLGRFKCTTCLDSTDDKVTEAAVKEKRLKIFEPGCILFPRSGSVALNHRGILGIRAGVVSHIGVLRNFRAIVTRDWLFWFLVTYDMGQIAKQTTNLDLVNFSDVRRILVPIAPLPIQRRIVAEIEKLFTRLEAGVAALKRVQVSLKRYRAAVLKAACEGKLVPTEAELAKKAEGKRKKEERSRESGPPSVLPLPSSFESAAQLLTRILAERCAKWTGRGSYKEPVAPDTANLPHLPEGWMWTTLDTLAEVKGGITKDQKRKHTSPARSVPYLRVANVQRGYIDLTEVKEIEATEDEIQELALKPGDVLFNEGGDRDKLGRGWVWNGEIPECIHQNHVFRARLFDPSLHPKFVSWYANTFGQKFFFEEGKHTTNLASIGMSKLKGLPVPIPPPAEQQRIVAEVERRLSVIEELGAVVSANLQRATRLRQAVLQQAFTGHRIP